MAEVETRWETQLDTIRTAACALQLAEANYRRAHDLHGDAARETGRAWDEMRRAGDRVRRTLGADHG
ncbi:hypothetical protein N6H05_01845 [Sphingobium sp. WTD-1]|uniref:hypothetical protein n=1 Tax=Sphingobium sp. WTD-1 TaxID=2979467 RepID=UPI0024DEAF7B|nr:hypothetical protein [Sphingobium sp. WTD-1]WIA55470.1 hypothetical protein N6H05_20945 [Sphingobium sp. WTD-1]WIA56593.1 hypothetical protein N6H05_01845 [Sphingobium sp. WTD-1]